MCGDPVDHTFLNELIDQGPAKAGHYVRWDVVTYAWDAVGTQWGRSGDEVGTKLGRSARFRPTW